MVHSSLLFSFYSFHCESWNFITYPLQCWLPNFTILFYITINNNHVKQILERWHWSNSLFFTLISSGCKEKTWLFSEPQKLRSFIKPLDMIILTTIHHHLKYTTMTTFYKNSFSNRVSWKNDTVPVINKLVWG